MFRSSPVLVALCGVVFTIVLLALFQRPSHRADSKVGPLDNGVRSESLGGVLTLIKNSREQVRARFDRMLVYRDFDLLEGVSVEDDRLNSRLTVASRRCEVNKNRDLRFDGQVHIATSNGLIALTEHAVYLDQLSLLRIEGPVRFSSGLTSGSSVWMTYDRNRDLLNLREGVTITLTAAGPVDRRITVAASAAQIDRLTGIATFWGNVMVHRHEQLLQADSLIAHVAGDKQSIGSLDLRGGVRQMAAAGGPGIPRSMRAEEIVLELTGENLPRKARLTGAAQIEIGGERSASAFRLSSHSMEIDFGSDGAVVSGLAAHENITLDLAAEPRGPVRRIAATTLEMTFQGSSGPGAVLAGGGVEYSESRGDPILPDRVVRAASAAVSLTAGTNDVRDVIFSGPVRIVQGSMEAFGRDATYVVNEGSVDLVGPHDPGDMGPRLVDDQMVVNAGRMRLRIDPVTVEAVAGVRSVLLPRRSESATPGLNDGASASTVTSLLRRDAPILLVADRLTYDGAASRALYFGHASALQDQTLVQADRIELERATGDMVASGAVRTRLTLNQASPLGSQKKPFTSQQSTTVTAAQFGYREALRQVTYDGDAHLIAPDYDLHGQRIDVYLKPQADGIERLEADGDVLLKNDRGEASGDRLTYIDEDQRYELIGHPLTLVQACVEITGRSLLQDGSTGELLIDGNGLSRVHMTVSCKAPQARK